MPPFLLWTIPLPDAPLFGGEKENSKTIFHVAQQHKQFAELSEVKSDRLTLINVHRSMGGQYVCSASNGIPSQTSKTIPLYVKCEFFFFRDRENRIILRKL